MTRGWIDDEKTERKQPEAPECHGDDQAAAVNMQKGQRQDVQLRLRQPRQVVGSAQEYERRELGDEVGQSDGNASQHEWHHEHGLVPVHLLEQLVQTRDDLEGSDLN